MVQVFAPMRVIPVTALKRQRVRLLAPGMLALIGIVPSSASAHTRCGEEATCRFYPNHLELILPASTLSGTVGSAHGLQRWAASGAGIDFGCLASTPSIPVIGPAVVDVSFYYEASSSLWAEPKAARRDLVFSVFAGSQDPFALDNVHGAVTVGQIGGLVEYLPASAETAGRAYYTASTSAVQAYTLSGVEVGGFGERFAAHLCLIGAGAEVRLHRIAIKVRQQDEASPQPKPLCTGVPGAEDNLVSCELQGEVVATGCDVAPRVLAGPQEDEVEFRVRFLFDCPGAPLGIGLRTDIASVELQSRPHVQEPVLTGKGSLALGTAQLGHTRAAYVEPGCRLNIQAVSVVPSAATLARWDSEAKLWVATLRDRLVLLRLARGLEHILEWDQRQLALMRASLEDAIEGYLLERDASWQLCGGVDSLLGGRPPTCDAWVAAMADHPEMLHYVVLLIHAQAGAAGRTEVVLPPTVQTSASQARPALVSFYEAELQRAVKSSAALLGRMGAEQGVARSDLERSLADVVALATPAVNGCIDESGAQP